MLTAGTNGGGGGGGADVGPVGTRVDSPYPLSGAVGLNNINPRPLQQEVILSLSCINQ